MIKVVGSALIRNSEGKCLAVRIAKEMVGGVLVPPGGKLQENETVRECVVREVKEELGITIEIEKLEAIDEQRYEDGYWIFLMYKARILQGEPVIMEPDKIIEMKWADISELKNHDRYKWV